MKKLPAKIIVVEDDAFTRLLIVKLLEGAHYRVLEAEDGGTAVRLVKEQRPDLAIMDVAMPKMGGLAALESIRQQGFDRPVLILSGHGEIDHRLRGLRSGADDYMVKPFDGRELLARVAALLRRSPTTIQKPRILRRDDVVIDLAARRAERAGSTLSLTATEYAILDALVENAGRPLSRERLLELVWGYTANSTTRTVETHIWRLRKKIGDRADESAWIQNLQGSGYVLSTGIEEGVGAVPESNQTPAVIRET